MSQDPDMESYYHVASSVIRKSIVSDGLIPQVKNDVHIKRDPSIFLFDNFQHANYWAHWTAIELRCAVDICEVAIPSNEHLDRDEHREMVEFGAWKTPSAIPPGALRIALTMDVPTSWDPPEFTPISQDYKTRKLMPRPR